MMIGDTAIRERVERETAAGQGGAELEGLSVRRQ
jgi:hypothetical protein